MRLSDGLRWAGRLEIRDQHGNVRHARNEFVAASHAAQLLAGMSADALDASAKLRVLDSGAAVVLAPRTVDVDHPTEAAGVLTYRWSLLDGVAEGEWHDVYVQTAAAVVVSQFVAAALGTKGSGDTWTVTYTLTVT